MPKININGITREMTAEEKAYFIEVESFEVEAPEAQITAEERFNEIEAALIELAAMLAGGA